MLKEFNLITHRIDSKLILRSISIRIITMREPIQTKRLCFLYFFIRSILRRESFNLTYKDEDIILSIIITGTSRLHIFTIYIKHRRNFTIFCFIYNVRVCLFKILNIIRINRCNGCIHYSSMNSCEFSS